MSKTTFHSGGASKCNVTHNQKDRKFLKQETQREYFHIDPSKSGGNLDGVFCDERRVKSTDNLEADVIEIYKNMYLQGFTNQNEKYIKKGQYVYVKDDIQEWFNSDKKGLRETILQIGKDGDRVKWKDTQKPLTDQELIEETVKCMVELNAWQEETYSQYKGISFSVHVDEKSIHIHKQETVFAFDESGGLVPNVSKGMEQMEVPFPDEAKIQKACAVAQEEENRKAAAEGRKPKTLKPSGTRYNNRLATFTAASREKWEEIVLEHGLDIEHSEKGLDQVHTEQRAYWAAHLKEENEELSQANDRLQTALKNMSKKVEKYGAFIDEMEEVCQTKLYQKMVADISRYYKDLKRKMIDTYQDLEHVPEEKMQSLNEAERFMKASETIQNLVQEKAEMDEIDLE